MSPFGMCQWLQSTSWATGIRESLDLYPTLYTVHIFGFVIMVTAMSVLCLRVLDLGLSDRPVASVARIAIPFAQGGLAANLTTGFMVFAAQAEDMYKNTAFRWKISMVLVAAANILFMETTIKRNAGNWGQRGPAPNIAKFSAVASILLWLGIVAMSRVIGFTGTHE
jgi:hypothetical protein